MRATATFRVGMAFAIASAVTFGMSGPFAKALMEAGWSPLAAVTARMVGGAIAIAVFASLAHRGWVREALAHARTVVFYGLIPIAGAQLCYYNAVAHLSVGVALLLEYLAPVLVVGWVWATTRRRPSTLTLLGATFALAGIVIVLDVFSGAQVNATPADARSHLAGVAWALGATVCAACYFVLSDRAAADGNGLHPLTLAAGGLIVGAAAVALIGTTRVLPMTFTTNDAIVAGHAISFLIPVVVVGVVSTAAAYALGISGVARLRPSYASLVGLGEVLSAALWAWLLVGESITATQALGGAVVLAGLALAGRSSDHRTVEATWPDLPSPSPTAAPVTEHEPATG